MIDITHPGYQAALAEARHGYQEGGVPIGAALVVHDTVVARGHNLRVQQENPIIHGEMAALQAAGRRRDYKQMTLFTTLAPCDMCTGAILLFGIPHVVVGENQSFAGQLEYLQARGVTVTVLHDADSRQLMLDFQHNFPEVWAEDIGQ